MSTPHPDFWDKLSVKIYSRYLYRTQLCQTLATVNIGLIHKLPEVKPYWKIMDFLYLKKDSTMRFLGLAKNLKFSGDVKPSDSIFELVNPIIDESKSADKHVSGGDVVCITPFDRKFITASPNKDLQNTTRLYYTAADQ